MAACSLELVKLVMPPKVDDHGMQLLLQTLEKLPKDKEALCTAFRVQLLL